MLPKRRLLCLLTIAVTVLWTGALFGQSVVTSQPDPAHPILSQAFQDQSDTQSDSILTGYNQLELLENGNVAFPRMLQEMAAATQTLFCSTMLFSNDAAGRLYADGLIAAASRGVDVRLILDGLYANPFLVWRLRRGGVKVLIYNPRFDIGGRKHRYHQKVVIRDFDTVIIGGMNVGNAYLMGNGQNDYYKDTAVAVQGFAAGEVTLRYLNIWLSLRPMDFWTWIYLAQAGLYTQGSSFPAGRDGRTRYIQQESDLGEDYIARYYARCFGEARHQIIWHVNNLRPAGQVFDAIKDADRRGVRVVLITNSKEAFMARSGRLAGWIQWLALKYFYYPKLDGTGIELWEMDTPIHSKALTIDGVMCSIGSYNFSDISDENLEGTMICYDPFLVTEVELMFDRDLMHANRIR